MKNTLSYLLGGMLLITAIAHIVMPEVYAEMIPPFIPASLANILAVITEAGIGILLFLPKYRHWGGAVFFLINDCFFANSYLGFV